jgi:hypothetical protein
MSQTLSGPAWGRQRAGGVIIAVASCLAAVLVTAGLVYAAGTGGRHQAALAAAGCEPNLSPSGLQCTTVQMLTGKYMKIMDPAIQQLNADVAAYRASEWHHLGAATTALRAEATTEQALAANLEGFPFPAAVVPLAKALFPALSAYAKLTGEQARSSSLTLLRSFNVRVRMAGKAVRADVRRIGRALDARPAAPQEP